MGSKSKPMMVDSDGEEETSYKNLSMAELIAILKKHKISPKGTVGSPPNLKRSGSGHSAEEEESSSGSSSTSSSSSSSVENMTKKATSPSSVEGGITVRKLGHGE